MWEECFDCCDEDIENGRYRGRRKKKMRKDILEGTT
jgi:hypothetical protein